MKIEEIYPEVVGGKASLSELLTEKIQKRGLTNEQAQQLLAEIPSPLIDSGAFFDKRTGIWRYEFGQPFEIEGKFYWGTHMWQDVSHLSDAALVARGRLNADQRQAFFARLNDPARHPATLAEMMPAIRLAVDVQSEFEVAGYGNGNSTLDWALHFGCRRVLLDVKSRSKDFIEQAKATGDAHVASEPAHDPTVLFQSVECKFVAADPSLCLQGAWIATHIRQPAAPLDAAFSALDPQRVHFAILGDWRSDALLLVKREEDRPFLEGVFQITPSSRFTST